jgi:hypothetical protein
LASRAAESGTIPRAFFDIARELVAQQDSEKPASA